MNAELLVRAKSFGFSDRQIAYLTGGTEDQIRVQRRKLGLVPSYRLVDTCAAEFEAYTPYYYSTYDCGDDEITPTSKRKVMILGGGPNRIGQGIEFDYCCVHAAFALKEDGFETLMVNSNPETVSTDYELTHYMRFAVEASPERPVLVDKFLEDATEVDVDCIADVGHFADPAQGTIVIGGMLEHIEYAGVHSGDAAMVLPAHTLSQKVIQVIRAYTHALARELKVIGLMNVQYAVKGETVYVLEVNPRASRTVPFVSKAIGVPLAKLAAKVMAGKTLKQLGFIQEIWPKYWAVKGSVFPFDRFQGQ